MKFLRTYSANACTHVRRVQLKYVKSIRVLLKFLTSVNIIVRLIRFVYNYFVFGFDITFRVYQHLHDFDVSPRRRPMDRSSAILKTTIFIVNTHTDKSNISVKINSL